ncbi:hypothetical protein Cgig2_025687 [Carnegiea gigantea]|uniref:Uncharacterized protein n=1 Tax=Carnegiea gigantea TaxID=171969 RepID=A0A9Q1JU76_9CARY|nr:hypothetical protein Cgig2_025687 [Carnegiea gigantea]
MVHFSNFTSTKMAAEYVQETFQCPLRETSAERLRPLPEDHLILCPSFDAGVATRYAQDSNTPEMVQAIFYATVVNEVAKWGITEAPDVGPAAATLGSLRVLVRELEYRLRGARILRPVNLPADLTSSSGPVEVSGLGDAPPVSLKALLEYSFSSSNSLLESSSSAGTPSYPFQALFVVLINYVIVLLIQWGRS